MRWSDIPRNPPTSTLRWFAAIGTGLLATLAALQGFRSDNLPVALLLLGFAVVVALLGILRPRALRPVFVAMLILGFPINWVMTHVLLGLVFYCVLTPVAIWFKIVGRDALARRFERDRASYWIAKPAASDVRSYFRQS